MTFREPFYRRALYMGFGAFLIVCSIPLGYYLIEAHTNGGKAIGSLLFFIAVICSGIGLVATSLRYQLTLTSRTLTLRRAFGTWSISRKNISGYSLVHLYSPLGANNENLLLFSGGRRRYCLNIPCVFEDNAAVVKWLDGIPNVQ